MEARFRMPDTNLTRIIAIRSRGNVLLLQPVYDKIFFGVNRIHNRIIKEDANV